MYLSQLIYVGFLCFLGGKTLTCDVGKSEPKSGPEPLKLICLLGILFYYSYQFHSMLIS